MCKRTCALAIVLLLIAGPVLAADRSDDGSTGLRAALAWVLDLVGYGDVERAAPDARQKHMADIVLDGSAPPNDDGGDRTRYGVEATIDG